MKENVLNGSCKGVLIAFVISCLLVVSWLIPVTRLFWDYLDAMTYLSVHHFFLQGEFGQKFWAVMNSRVADNVSHFLFISVLIWYIVSDKGKFIRQRTGQVAFILVAVVLSVLISKWVQHELSNHMSIKRDSPSIVLGYEVALSKVLPGLKNVKDASSRSFPGDHAMTLMLLCGFTFCFVKKTGFRVAAIVIAIIFMMPRLISGGHWLTDLIMGSLPIAIFALMLWLGVYALLLKIISRKKIKDLNQKN